MYRRQTVFSQLMRFVLWMAFFRIVARYRGDRGVRKLNCAQQFRAMAFAQLTRRNSLRDLVACLDAVPSKRCHAGFPSPIGWSALARANQRRSWHICEALALSLIARARPLYADEDLGLHLEETDCYISHSLGENGGLFLRLLSSDQDNFFMQCEKFASVGEPHRSPPSNPFRRMHESRPSD